MSEKTSNPSLLRRLFGFVWGFAVGIYRIFFVLGLVVIGLVVWSAFQGGTPLRVEDNVALIVAPSGALVEQIDRDPGQELIEKLVSEAPAQTLVRDVTDALETAAGDPRIAFAVLKLDGLYDAGLPQLEEIAAAMKKFQASGKKIVAYGPWYEQIQYYTATQADEIVLDPMGMVALEGFSSYNNYFKDALDKLGVQMHVFRVGEYKSAVEPFLRNDMSAEAKAANREWLGDLWGDYLNTVAQSRRLPDDAAQQYVTGMRAGLQQLKGDAARYAMDSGLITHLETLTEFRKRMGAVVGFDEGHGSFRQIHFMDYLQATRREQLASTATPAGTVALVVVQGEIVDGEGEPGYAGGDTIVEMLDDARRDKSVSAVVLRVDSPGGSVWASEQIRRAVRELKAAGKPVVASMSSVAASGGYWVSMDANEIWAHTTTITGSIGIFGLMPTIEKPLNKLGIHTDGVGTTPLAGAFRLDRPMSPEFAAIVQSQIDKGYQDFIDGVAAARKLPVNKVDEIARGRVWSGQRALQLGLIDHTGGLVQAADAAAKLAGLEPGGYELQEFMPDRSFTARFFESFSSRMGQSLLPGWAAQLFARADLGQVLKGYNDPRGLYAHCLCTPGLGGRLR